jgi:hypothetical protein
VAPGTRWLAQRRQGEVTTQIIGEEPGRDECPRKQLMPSV